MVLKHIVREVPHKKAILNPLQKEWDELDRIADAWAGHYDQVVREMGPLEPIETKRTPEGSPDIYGSVDNPLSQSQHDSLMLQLNAEYGDGQRPREADKFYSTVIIRKSLVASTLAGTSYDTGNPEEDMVDFIRAHHNEWNRMLQDGTDYSEVVARRYIFVEDDVDGPPSWSPSYLTNGYHDSNGTILLNVMGPYGTESPHWDEGAQIDTKLVHEMGHWILDMPDTYSLNYNMLFSGSPAFAGVPLPWRLHQLAWQGTIGPGIMNGSMERTLDEYERWMLARRVDWEGGIHNGALSKPEASRYFPHHVPDKLTFAFPGWNGADAVVYGRTEVNGEGTFVEVVAQGKLDGQGEIKVDAGSDRQTVFSSHTVYDGKVVKPTESMLFVRLQKPDGTVGWRPIGLPEISLAMADMEGKGTYDAGKGMVMSMTPATAGDINPWTFDPRWRVSASNPKTHTIFTPIIRG